MIMATVVPVTEVTGYTIKLSPQEARQLYRDIESLLSSVGVMSPQSRDKFGAPMVYGLYDSLYSSGAYDGN